MLVVAEQGTPFGPTITIPVRGSSPKVYKRIGQQHHYGKPCIMYECPECHGAIGLRTTAAAMGKSEFTKYLCNMRAAHDKTHHVPPQPVAPVVPPVVPPVLAVVPIAAVAQANRADKSTNKFMSTLLVLVVSATITVSLYMYCTRPLVTHKSASSLSLTISIKAIVVCASASMIYAVNYVLKKLFAEPYVPYDHDK